MRIKKFQISNVEFPTKFKYQIPKKYNVYKLFFSILILIFIWHWKLDIGNYGR